MSKPVDISLTEQAVMNTDRLPEGMKDWRMYRIEYGPGGPEGVIWLPRSMNPEYLEGHLRMYAGEDARLKEMWEEPK